MVLLVFKFIQITMDIKQKDFQQFICNNSVVICPGVTDTALGGEGCVGGVAGWSGSVQLEPLH